MVTVWGMAEGVSAGWSALPFSLRGGSQFGCKYLDIYKRKFDRTLLLHS
jgi:hypothetical protein